jgi:hypothetical protein
MRNILSLSIFAVLLPCLVAAQDNHYEFMKMGSRNSVLANSGLSRFEDQAAVITNPATLSFANSSSFSFNSTAVGISTINFKNGLGQGFDIKYGNMNVLPTMAAGVLKPKKNKKDWVLGYSLYHSMNDRLRFTDRNKYEVNIINDAESPGNENYLAQYNLSHDVDEVTGVLGIGWNLNDQLALGISQSFTYRSEEYNNTFTASAIPLTGSTSTVDFVSYNTNLYTSYYRIMAQTKLGLAWQLEKWDIGLTATLPSLGLFGTGTVIGEGSLNNIHPGGDLTKPRTSYFASGSAQKQKATYKKSMAVGLGISRPFGKVRMYGAINAYGAVKNYSIMDPGPVDFIQPNTPSNEAVTADFMRIWAGNRTVVNWSLGGDWNYEGTRHMLFSFHTDKQFANVDPDEPGHNLTVKNWDNYHIGVGTQQTFGSSDWVIGLRYSFAKKDDARQPYSFDDPSEGNNLQGVRRTGTLVATSIQLMLSYAFRFK